MKRSATAAVKVLGHLEGCPTQWDQPERPKLHQCTCTYPDEILVAAARKTLRREHKTRIGSPYPNCERCGHGGTWDTFNAGPCYPPLDGALAWELVLAIAACAERLSTEADPEPFRAFRRGSAAWRQLTEAFLRQEPIKAIARLWIRLWEYGLIG